MKDMLLNLMILCLVVYAGLAGALYLLQRQILYYPTSIATGVDENVLWLESEGERIKVWAINSERDNAVIYFGGNAEAVEANIGFFKDLLPNHSVYLVNYRGYGGSTGSPAESALYADSINLFDEIAERHEDISVIGRSLGSAVATYLAAHRDIKRVALITPYDSVLSMAKRLYRIFPVEVLLKDRFDSISHLAQISRSILVVIAEDDRVIARIHSENLADAIPPARLTKVIISNAGHNNISFYPEYGRILERFFEGDIEQRLR